MLRKVIPTVFARNRKQFRKRLKRLLELHRDLQIDFMDGKFVNAKGIKVNDVPNLQEYGRNFEAHLMCSEPAKYIIDLKNKGFRKIIFHYEAVKDKYKILGLILYIKNHGMKAIIALNPETDINVLNDFFDYIDGVLIMGVHSGRENRKFISKVYGKIRRLRKINRKIKIQVDGGVNLQTASKLRKLKVNIVNTGSFVSEADNPKEALRELEKVFK